MEKGTFCEHDAIMLAGVVLVVAFVVDGPYFTKCTPSDAFFCEELWELQVLLDKLVMVITFDPLLLRRLFW